MTEVMFPLTAGERVAIYRDPIRRRGFEGEAVLIQKVGTGPGYEEWEVSLPAELFPVRRVIATE